MKFKYLNKKINEIVYYMPEDYDSDYELELLILAHLERSYSLKLDEDQLKYIRSFNI